MNFIEKITIESMKTLQNTLQWAEVESRIIVRSGFDDRLRGKLPPGYGCPSIYIGNVNRSSILRCQQPVYFRDSGVNKSTIT